MQPCQICRRRPNDAVLGETIRPSIVAIIRKSHPNFSDKRYVCRQDLDRFRQQYIQEMLAAEKGELSRLDKEVLRSMAKHEILVKNIDREFARGASLADRLSDRIASFGGSWTFIILFAAVMGVWISVNVFALIRPFDPFPFILLNLVLSTLAAIQAPIILMSQRRREDKDRLRAEYDYKVNLKAELEIRHLHEKVDHLISHQWQRLLEIQEMQLELLQEMKEKKR